MLNSDFNSPSDYIKHTCQSFRDGDWIIYKCPQCDYELRENWRTGKLSITNAKPNIKHTGSYFPTEYREVFENLN